MRKEVLVEHGFRLPSAMDNRPLKFEEFEQMWNQVVFVSATPGKIELEKTGGEVVEQVIRPTGLVDPEIDVQPAQGQVPHLLGADQGAGRARRARAGHDADQAAGRGPVARTSRKPASAGGTCTARSRRSSASRSSATCARATSTCWSASTCCARGSTCRKCRWSRSSTPTRRGSCAARRRSSRRSAAPRET